MNYTLKDRTCMCSHKKSEHIKKRFVVSRECNFCECFDYMRNGRPSLSDKITAIFGVVMIGMFIFLPLYILYMIKSLDNNQLSQLVGITLKEYLYNEFLLTACLVILLPFFIFNMFIENYFKMCRRKKRT